MHTSPNRSIRIAIAPVALFLSLVLIPTARAQMSIVSLTPAHGTEYVNPTDPLVVEFSEPIDTSATFGGDEFFISAQLFPETGPPLGYSLNETRTQLSVLLDLADDTQYNLIILGAKSTTGELLDQPKAVTFSTGMLATGTVTGTVTFPGSTPETAIVGLLPPDFLSQTFGNDGGGDSGPPFAAVTVVSGSDGAYQIDYAPPGMHLPATFRDVDRDGEPNSGVEGEGLGFYDPDQDRAPDVVTLSAGQTLTDVDMELRTGESTALPPVPDATALAQQARADAALTVVQGTELTPAGESSIWIYVFHSAMTTDTLGVALFFDYLVPLEGLSFGGDGGPVLFTAPLPGGVIDSDMAMQIAEDHGGTDYRASHPDARIEVGLFNADFGAGKSGSIAEAQTVWFVAYRDWTNPYEAQFIIDAVTGVVLHIQGIDTAAQSELIAAAQTAGLWQADAELVQVSSQAPIGPAGKASAWQFVFHSTTADGLLYVVTSSGFVIDQWTGGSWEVPSIVALPEVWVNSDMAGMTAEAASGGFRMTHPEAHVEARLTRGLGSDPDRVLWEFSYRPFPWENVTLTIYVDGVTGAVTTGTEATELPAETALLERYPNPTQGAVALRYELTEPGQARITVMNVLGQTVRHLVSESVATGSQTAHWDGTDDAGRRVASGLYWIRLETEWDAVTKPVTIVR